MTLTTALTFCMGGAPAGPAGTGKTETVKDIVSTSESKWHSEIRHSQSRQPRILLESLHFFHFQMEVELVSLVCAGFDGLIDAIMIEDLAKSLAISCVVTNCGDGLDFRAMGVIFSGLSETGPSDLEGIRKCWNRRKLFSDYIGLHLQWCGSISVCSLDSVYGADNLCMAQRTWFPRSSTSILAKFVCTGFWGCFDEFNRINVEVQWLSCKSATGFRMYQNVIAAGVVCGSCTDQDNPERTQRPLLNLEDLASNRRSVDSGFGRFRKPISLPGWKENGWDAGTRCCTENNNRCVPWAVSTVSFNWSLTRQQKEPCNGNWGYFITMNPGYAGRSELPDNLKAFMQSFIMSHVMLLTFLCFTGSIPASDHDRTWLADDLFGA